MSRESPLEVLVELEEEEYLDDVPLVPLQIPDVDKEFEEWLSGEETETDSEEEEDDDDDDDDDDDEEEDDIINDPDYIPEDDDDYVSEEEEEEDVKGSSHCGDTCNKNICFCGRV